MAAASLSRSAHGAGWSSGFVVVALVAATESLPRPPAAGGLVLVGLAGHAGGAVAARALDPDHVAVAARRGRLHKIEGVEARVPAVNLVLAGKDNDVTGGAEEHAVEHAVGGNHGAGEAHVAHGDVGAGHAADAAEGEGQGAQDVDDGVDEEGRVVGEVEGGDVGVGGGGGAVVADAAASSHAAAAVAALLGVGVDGLGGFAAEVDENGNVEARGEGEGDEDEEVVGEEAEVGVFDVHPALVGNKKLVWVSLLLFSHCFT